MKTDELPILSFPGNSSFTRRESKKGKCDDPIKVFHQKIHKFTMYTYTLDKPYGLYIALLKIFLLQTNILIFSGSTQNQIETDALIEHQHLCRVNHLNATSIIMDKSPILFRKSRVNIKQQYFFYCSFLKSHALESPYVFYASSFVSTNYIKIAMEEGRHGPSGFKSPGGS